MMDWSDSMLFFTLGEDIICRSVLFEYRGLVIRFLGIQDIFQCLGKREGSHASIVICSLGTVVLLCRGNVTAFRKRLIVL
jgi:hypothetical protein